ncbi:MAG: NAD(P)/FAD-dependent oxidoreductase [Desulfococcaceae bacterium]|jgi:phytoene dehydrogenase-like protein|nr:NAD(P)/FAD-dependent oxidoreductase [Desulfococcaceae bacterium]
MKHRVIIIGAGAGGLSMAIILAKCGFSVTVIEKNRFPGGMMRSYIRKGIACHTGIHYLGALAKGQILRRFFDWLGITADISLERMGKKGIIDRYIFNDFLFDLPEGADAYENNLRSAFPHEQKQIDGIMAMLRPAVEKISSPDFLFAEHRDAASPGDFLPVGKILDDLGCSPGLKAVLSVPSCWIGVPPDQCPAFYHNTALASYLLSSWRVKENVQMADVFANRLLSLGGKLICGDGAAAILAENREVKGLRLLSGRELTAPLLIGAVHPKVILSMLPAKEVRPLYRKRISQLKDTHSIFALHATVDASRHDEIPYNIFKMDSCEKGEISDLKYYQLRKSSVPDKLLFSILTSGRPEHWQKWEKTQSGRRGKDYTEAKEKMAKQLIAESESILGPLYDCRLLDTYTPLSIRDRVGSPGGSAYGIMRSCDQLLAASMLNRTAVKGLFLAGQNVTAPGILGTVMGSFHTAGHIVGAEKFRKEIAENL